MGRRLPAEPVGVPQGGRTLEAVVIGASTGGPKVVENILRSLKRDFPAPLAVCQHMPPGFIETWAERLDQSCSLRVKEAQFGERFEKGTAYIAPIGKHMRLKRDSDGTVSISLDRDFADSLHIPSIDMLMSSAAQAYGSVMLAVLLTGLGSDGALGMLAVRRAGGHTISEAPESAVAYSMPGSAVEMGAAAEEVASNEMPRVITDRVDGKFWSKT